MISLDVSLAAVEGTGGEIEGVFGSPSSGGPRWRGNPAHRAACVGARRRPGLLAGPRVSVKVTASLERRPADRHAAAPDGRRWVTPARARPRAERRSRPPRSSGTGAGFGFIGAGAGRHSDEGDRALGTRRSANPAGHRWRSRSRCSARGEVVSEFVVGREPTTSTRVEPVGGARCRPRPCGKRVATTSSWVAGRIASVFHKAGTIHTPVGPDETDARVAVARWSCRLRRSALRRVVGPSQGAALELDAVGVLTAAVACYGNGECCETPGGSGWAVREWHKKSKSVTFGSSARSWVASTTTCTTTTPTCG